MAQVGATCRGIRQLDLGFPEISTLGVQGGVRSDIKSCPATHFEYAMIDETLARVHQHDTVAKRGLKVRPLAARASG